MWERLFWKGVWLFCDPSDCVRLRTVSTHWSVPRKYGPLGELFFPIKKEPVVASNEVSSDPFDSAETLKACALTGLHLLAGDDAGLGGGQSPESADMWRYGYPKKP